MSEWICDGCCRRFDAAASQGTTNTTVEEVRFRARLAEVEANYLDCARAIGIVYEADGHADVAGPHELVVERIREAARDRLHAGDWQIRAERAMAELERLRAVVAKIAALADVCGDCEEEVRTVATHVTADPFTGWPLFLCAQHAQTCAEAYRKAESKGCGAQPEIRAHEQDEAVSIALAALDAEER